PLEQRRKIDADIGARNARQMIALKALVVGEDEIADRESGLRKNLERDVVAHRHLAPDRTRGGGLKPRLVGSGRDEIGRQHDDGGEKKRERDKRGDETAHDRFGSSIGSAGAQGRAFGDDGSVNPLWLTNSTWAAPRKAARSIIYFKA